MGRSLLVVALLAGCSGIDFADYDDAALDARCDYLVRCGLFADSAACKQYLLRTAIESPNLEAAIEMGKTSYDEDAAEECLESFDSASCDGTTKSAREPADACDRVFTGNGKMGEACTFDIECESDHCLVPDCPDACCMGTCAAAPPLADINQSCANLDCVDGAYCGFDAICHALLPAGAVCDSLEACDYGLSCIGITAMTSGACKALPKTGAPCPDLACAEIGDVCKAGICVALGLPGDACTSRADCSFYYDCDATNVCAAFPTRGMPCLFTCSDDSWCAANGGGEGFTCVAQKPNGAACIRNDECQSHYCPNDMCGDVPLCI